MYQTVEEILDLAAGRDVPLWQIILESEMAFSALTEDAVFDLLDERYAVMVLSAEKALSRPLSTAGGLIEGIASRQHTYTEEQGGICGNFINLLMSRALSCSETNAAMGKICAAPTAGACGILPAVLISVGEKYFLPRRKILEGLLTASGIGGVIANNSTVSGAEGGCQAECGVAAAMAAAAAAQMAGGSNQMIVDAACFALMNVMGLVCDPIAGLVQTPCAQRNASQAVNAILSADLALSGSKSIIPMDEIIEAMYKVGKMLPTELKETAQGGIAATPTAKALQKQIFS